MAGDRTTTTTLTDTLFLGPLVEQPFDVGAHRRRGFVEKGVARLLSGQSQVSSSSSNGRANGSTDMVHQPRHRHPLLLAAGEHVLPLLTGIPAPLAVGQVPEPDLLEDAAQLAIAPSAVAHVHLRVRIDDLIPKRADAEVGSLRQEHDAVGADAARSAHETAVDGPQAGHDPSDGALADAVGARDQEVLAGPDDDGQGLDQLVAAARPERRRHDRHVLETDAVEALVDRALRVRERVRLGVAAPRREVGARVAAVEGRDERVDARGVAGQLREILDRVHHAAAGVGEREHEALVRDEVFHAVAVAVAVAAVVPARVRELEDAAEAAPGRQEDGQRRDDVAKGAPAVLEDKVLEHVVADAQAVEPLHPALELGEAPVEEVPLGVGAAVEGDLLGVRDEARVQGAEVALASALDGLELAKGRRQPPQQRRRDEVVAHEAGEGQRAQRTEQLVVEDAEVDEGLPERGVQRRGRGAEERQILGDELVGALADGAVEVRQAVVVEAVVEVEVVDVAGQAGAEGDRDLGLQELDRGVGVAGQAADAAPLDDAPDEGAAVGGDEVAHDLAVEAGDDEGEVGAEDEEDAVAEQQGRLLAVPARHDDAEQAQELVQEGQVEARLDLGRRHVRGRLAVAQPDGARRVQEEPSVGVKRGRLGRVDGDLGGRGLVGHEDGARAVLGPKARVSPQESPALLPLSTPALPPPPPTLAAA